MCEPHHSIIQVSEELSKGQYLGKFGKWCKKIGGYFHLSKMGKGHHEALRYIGQRYNIKGKQDYEVAWWNRELRPDFCIVTDIEIKFAKKYADATSIGSLHALRQFLTSSLNLSRSPEDYIYTFRHKFLTKKGKKQLDNKLRGQLDIKTLNRIEISKSLVNAVLGFTRKRNLIVPEWSHDDKLWVPGR
jgi:hypothetical protein